MVQCRCRGRGCVCDGTVEVWKEREGCDGTVEVWRERGGCDGTVEVWRERGGCDGIYSAGVMV